MNTKKIKEIVTAAFASLNNILKEPALRIGVSKLEADNFSVMINTWIPSHGFEDGRLQINEKLMVELKKAGLMGAS